VIYKYTRRLRVKHGRSTAAAGKRAGLNTAAVHEHFDGTTASGRGLGGVTMRVYRGHGLAKSYGAGRETTERKSLPPQRNRRRPRPLTVDSARASSHPVAGVRRKSSQRASEERFD